MNVDCDIVSGERMNVNNKNSTAIASSVIKIAFDRVKTFANFKKGQLLRKYATLITQIDPIAVLWRAVNFCFIESVSYCCTFEAQSQSIKYQNCFANKKKSAQFISNSP